MVIKLSKFERIAGLMVGGVLVGLFVVTVAVAVKKGWFEAEVELRAVFSNADGLHRGTQVLMSGLRVGEIKAVDLKRDNSIEVTFVIKEKFFDRIREDSVVQVVRPFVIGDKVLDLTVGSPQAEKVVAGELIHSMETTDVMDLLSGRKLGPAIETLQGLTNNLKVLAEAFADPQRVQALIRAFDTINPLITKLEVMASDISYLSKQVTRDDNLEKMVRNLVVTTRELNHILPAINEDSPRIGEDVVVLARNLAVLTQEFRKVVPALQAVAPDLPQASQQAILALDELVITLKALQNSFLLSGQAEEIRRELKMKKPMPGANSPLQRLPAGGQRDE